ncbi:DUF5615 family PIN-like protein [Neolewinella sp.]|uniref:DUF5615 family PIN-like protein n=1 Tax=Neolewinella sp. TaxID=2993543 RepID=UPI003B516C2F
MRTTVFEDHRSASDDEVLNIADELDAIIVTEDKDFGELTFRLGKHNRGIVLMRLSGMPVAQTVALVSQVLTEKNDELYTRFTIIQAKRVRIRSLKL